MSFSEKIKSEALESFEDFVIQALLPTDDEIKGIQEHNRLDNWKLCNWHTAFHFFFPM